MQQQDTNYILSLNIALYRCTAQYQEFAVKLQFEVIDIVTKN